MWELKWTQHTQVWGRKWELLAEPQLRWEKRRWKFMKYLYGVIASSYFLIRRRNHMKIQIIFSDFALQTSSSVSLSKPGVILPFFIFFSKLLVMHIPLNIFSSSRTTIKCLYNTHLSSISFQGDKQQSSFHQSGRRWKRDQLQIFSNNYFLKSWK